MPQLPSSWTRQNARPKRLVLDLSVVLLVLVGVSSSFAAVEVGDDVKFERAGQTFSGKVVGVRPGGTFLEVETIVDGTSRKLIVKATSVTPITKPNARGMRTWSDSTGQFKIEAALESQTAFEVVLRKSDGTTVKVALEKLSVADQEYVAGLDSGNENPFGSAAMESSGASSGDSGSRTVGRGALALPTPTKSPNSKELLIQKMPPPNGVEADPSSLDFSEVTNAGMGLPEAESRESVGRPLVISPAGTDLCYNVRSARGAPQHYTKLYVIDGKKRDAKQIAKLEGDSIWLCSADPQSGDVLGVVMKRGDDKSRSLCVISGIRDGNPRVVAHWNMFPGDDSKADYVRFRKILANQVAVTVYGGQVHAFDYGKGQEIWKLSAKMFNEPAITAGGRFAACMGDNQCAIVEAKTGKQIGSIPVDSRGSLSLGFSPDGLRLALAEGTRVRVVDVASGEERLVHEATVPLGSMGKPVLWLDDEYLLLPMGVLLNLERNLIVWKYHVDQDAIEFTDLQHHGLLTFTGRNATSIIRLPHAAARAATDRDSSNITAVKSGDSIAIVANASGPGVPANDLRRWLGEAASRSNYRESASSRTQLVATITRGKTQTQSYRIIGRGFTTEEVTFTPYISKVEIRQNGTTLWQQSRSSGLPFMISGDKTLQQAARENERPDAKFFQSITLPRQILKPEFQNGFGSSRVSAAGIADR